MDEAYVVLVASAAPGESICQAFPFATKAGAEKAARWFEAFAESSTMIVDDHEEE